MLTLLVTIIWLFSLLSAAHALLNKRDPRAGLGWIVACLSMPGIGALFYWLLGVNRIRSQAREDQQQGQGMHWVGVNQLPAKEDIKYFPDNPTARELIRLTNALSRRPLTHGNEVTVLYNGEQAYPAMLEQIDSAQESVYLASYILQPDNIGHKFATALCAAADRGADVRVLIDGCGELYSLTRIRNRFRDTKVKYTTFMPLTDTRSLHFNLRNHRKLLIVDNKQAFTGGMNIRDRHFASSDDHHRIIDLHFSLRGPICDQLREAFMEDWHFANREKRKPKAWPRQEKTGNACCRGISAGPNEEQEKLHWLFIGALACARSHVRIMTPYFMPNRAQLAAINVAALRGIRVEILLPGKNNLPFVNWAANALLFELLEHDVQIFRQPPPFVHSKLLLIDDEYALVGSANLDPRSLRLNFEFNVEIYARDTVAELIEHFDQSRDAAEMISIEEMDGRSLPVRLRDSFFKLFLPYL